MISTRTPSKHTSPITMLSMRTSSRLHASIMLAVDGDLGSVGLPGELLQKATWVLSGLAYTAVDGDLGPVGVGVD
jgi:hypothetical protein